ncbi:hypothetical protein [Mycobacteroides abscessus]
MTDPDTDRDTEVRTWEQMDVPERDPNVDPFTYFGPGPGDDLDL